MKRLFFIWLVIWVQPVLSQQKEFSISFQNESLDNALSQIEKVAKVKIYYNPVGMDTLAINGNYQGADIQQLIDSFVKPLGYATWCNDGSCILTFGSFIIDQPEIVSAFERTTEITDAPPAGLIFKEEYQLQKDNQNEVVEIGSKVGRSQHSEATLLGYVRNVENNEGIVGAIIHTPDRSLFASTNETGFYSLRLPIGKHTLFIQYVGMKTLKKQIVLFGDGHLDVHMDVDVIGLEEVVINSERDRNVEAVKLGARRLVAKDVKNIPLALGENDIMKVATTTAGIQTLGEGAAGYNVRGGKSDQNLILLNQAPVYNANHFFGFFSVFNSDAIENMEVYKSSMPSKYGGRLSSVFEVTSKSPSKEKFNGYAGVSPVSARLGVETPIVKDQAALSIAGRTTYSNWVLEQIDDVGFRNNRIAFGDLMARYEHEINEKNGLSATYYYSQDRFRLNSDTLFSFTNIQYANNIGTVSWNHSFGNKLDGQLTGYVSDYGYDLTYDESIPNSFKQDFGITEFGLRADFNHFLNDRHHLSYGAVAKFFNVNQGSRLPLSDNSDVLPIELQESQGREEILYVRDEITFTPKLSIALGLRYGQFSALGGRNVQTYAEGATRSDDTATGLVSFDQNEVITTYRNPEYRLAARYAINEATSIKMGATRTTQNVHTLSNSAALSPTDTWTLSGYHLKPQISDQLSAGIYKNMFQKLELSVEGYYKWMENLIDFKTGGEFLLNDHVETAALQGPGKSYGIEVSLRKSGKLNGWVNYTYARSFIQLDGAHPEERINRGEFYPTNYDKPHTVNLVANYKLTRRINFSFNTVYNSGRPVTYPRGAYDFKGVELIHFGDRNAQRIPHYFRMDVGFTIEESHLIKKFTHAYWSFSVYNLLGRDNPYSVFFDAGNGEVNGYQLVIFGSPIPTVSYNFRF